MRRSPTSPWRYPSIYGRSYRPCVRCLSRGRACMTACWPVRNRRRERGSPWGMSSARVLCPAKCREARLFSIKSSCLHCQVLRDRPEGQRGEEGKAANDADDADEKDHEQAAAGRQCSGRAGRDLLGGERACDRQHGYDHKVAPDEHRQRERQIVKRRIRVETCESTSVGRRSGCERVKDLRKTVRAG